MKYLIALALLCASAVHAQTGTAEWWLDGDSAKAYSTQLKCDQAALALNLDKAYACPRMFRVKPKPIPCPVAPASSQVVQCVAPAVGTWPQTRNVASAPSPQCWVTGEWTPVAAPAGACVTPTTQTWVKVADETDSFTVPDNTTIRFGLGTAWVQNVFSAGTYACKLDRFTSGPDPVPATRKQCERLTSGTPPPPPPPTATGSATLTWVLPILNADGSPLTDLYGLRVRYWKAGAAPGATVYTTVDVGVVSTVTIPNLAAGTWGFVVSAIDTSGNESGPSPTVSKTVQ